ncbi:unnamed protein product [Euphydryas editha]|uniref:Uncharacterized protein n=1 Tax=Euphydryas editha TaxID=104508 RepID=A0AAU9UZC3_EUPED|nr:unnamed protein product [Euphydryas editha]
MQEKLITIRTDEEELKKLKKFYLQRNIETQYSALWNIGEKYLIGFPSSYLGRYFMNIRATWPYHLMHRSCCLAVMDSETALDERVAYAVNPRYIAHPTHRLRLRDVKFLSVLS